MVPDPETIAPKDRSLTARSVKTRAKLVRAAREVFEKDAFVNARISDITAAAGVAAGTFYTHFETKEELFFAVADEVIDDVYVSTFRRESGDENFEGGVSLANRRHYETWLKNAKIMIAMDQFAEIEPEFHAHLANRRQQFIERYSERLRQLQAEGRVAEDLDPWHTAAALGAMVEQSCRWWVGRGEKHDPKIAVDTLDLLWKRAIAPPADPQGTPRRSRVS